MFDYCCVLHNNNMKIKLTDLLIARLIESEREFPYSLLRAKRHIDFVRYVLESDIDLNGDITEEQIKEIRLKYLSTNRALGL